MALDIETADPKGRFVSASIRLENAQQSALQLIAGSHALGKTVQQIQREQGYRRGEATTDTVLKWAREGNPDARLVEPQLRDGEAVLFDGGLWHASDRCRAAERAPHCFCSSQQPTAQSTYPIPTRSSGHFVF